MPKAGETPEMGANPLLGFGRVYARPEVARDVDRRVRRLLNEPGHTFEQFHGWLQEPGHHDLGRRGRHAREHLALRRGQDDRADGGLPPLRLAARHRRARTSRTWAASPCRGAWPTRAERASVLLDYRTPRGKVVEAIEAAYPGIRRENIHVWTLRGQEPRGAARRALGGVDRRSASTSSRTAGRRPSGIAVFTDSGTYAPTFLVGSWKDAAGATHVFLCDGYAATRRGDAGRQPRRGAGRRRDDGALLAHLRAALRREEAKLMQLDPDAPDFAARVRAVLRRAGRRRRGGPPYAEAIREAEASQRADRASPCSAPTTSCPRRTGACWRAIGYMCDDPYTGTPAA